MSDHVSSQTTKRRRTREERLMNIEARKKLIQQRAQARINRLMAQRAALLDKQQKQSTEESTLTMLRAIRSVAPEWDLPTIVGAISSAHAECLEDQTYLAEITEHGTGLLEKMKNR